MDFYILNLKDTKYDYSAKLPTDVEVRAFLEAGGMETGEVKIKANGTVSVFSTANPCERWKEFTNQTNTLELKQLALAIDIDKLVQYVRRCETGYEPSHKEVAATLNSLCKIALIQMKINV